MFCSDCGSRAQGKHCANCGSFLIRIASLAEKSIPPKTKPPETMVVEKMPAAEVFDDEESLVACLR